MQKGARAPSTSPPSCTPAINTMWVWTYKCITVNPWGISCPFCLSGALKGFSQGGVAISYSHREKFNKCPRKKHGSLTSLSFLKEIERPTDQRTDGYEVSYESCSSNKNCYTPPWKKNKKCTNQFAFDICIFRPTILCWKFLEKQPN